MGSGHAKYLECGVAEAGVEPSNVPVPIELHRQPAVSLPIRLGAYLRCVPCLAGLGCVLRASLREADGLNQNFNLLLTISKQVTGLR